MKKILFGLFFISLICFTSCSKEKDCKCTTTISGSTVSASSSTATIRIEDGKCRDMNSETTVFGVTTEVKCK